MRTRLLLTIFTLMLALMASCAPDGHYIAISGYAQGGVYSVKFNISGVDVPAERIKSDIDSILLRVDNSVSGYNKGSLLSRFNSGEPIAPDRIFEKMYAYACLFHSTYGGLVDAASGKLFDIWGFGFTDGELPDSASVSEALRACGMRRLKKLMSFEGILREDGLLYPQDLLVEGEARGEMPQLNFNAFAQGYTSDLVADYLHSLGVKDMLVDIGEIYCCGLNPSSKGWTIGIDKPFDGNDAPGKDVEAIWSSEGRSCGIVTSGNYRKFYIKDGKKYSHTIDPRTGYPVSHNLLSATIVAPTAAQADAMATICMVLGPDQAKAFIQADPELEGCLILQDSIWVSAGFTLKK